jgi:2-iminobutanoate/2-iminopropanoate deaminase
VIGVKTAGGAILFIDMRNDSCVITRKGNGSMMENALRKVETDKAPAAIGPYSQAMVAGNFMFTSGQLPVSPETGEVPTEFEAQVKQVFENLSHVLVAGGSSFNSVVKTLCFLKSMDDFAAFNDVYARYFKDHKPARSCVAVKTLPKNVLCEVEAVALIETSNCD